MFSKKRQIIVQNFDFFQLENVFNEDYSNEK